MQGSSSVARFGAVEAEGDWHAAVVRASASAASATFIGRPLSENGEDIVNLLRMAFNVKAACACPCRAVSAYTGPYGTGGGSGPVSHQSSLPSVKLPLHGSTRYIMNM